MIETGEKAPDFTLPDQDGKPVSLSDYVGQTVVLYFYPKADTPGCTAQACGLRDSIAEFNDVGAVVLGISPDPVAGLRAFADKYGLAFTLLADEGADVAQRYGVWSGHIERTTFLIDPEGVVARVFPSVRPAEHDELVLGALAELSASA